MSRSICSLLPYRQIPSLSWNIQLSARNAMPIDLVLSVILIRVAVQCCGTQSPIYFRLVKNIIKFIHLYSVHAKYLTPCILYQI